MSDRCGYCHAREEVVVLGGYVLLRDVPLLWDSPGQRWACVDDVACAKRIRDGLMARVEAFDRKGLRAYVKRRLDQMRDWYGLYGGR